ncbi:MAG: class I SAM-dependent methyltransferase [bacterium]
MAEATGINKYWTEFTELLKHENKNGYPEFFYYYCRHILDRGVFEKYILNVRYLFDLAKRPIAGSKILDCGCGFGIDSMILAAHGAAEVNGIDVNPDWIASIHKYLKELNWDLPIRTKVGDAAKLEYPDNTFDVLLSVEAISHYRNVDSFLREAYRVLKRDGVLIISDGNNGANPRVRKKTYEIWDRFENGPVAESFHGHQIKKCYKDMRVEIIARNFPHLSGAEVDELAQNTFGMGDKAIIKACEAYVKTGTKPNSRFKTGVPAFNPEKNDYIERLFDPRDLAAQMERIGFKATPYAHFGGAGEKGLKGTVNAILRTFSPITLLAAPTFKLVGVKK